MQISSHKKFIFKIHLNELSATLSFAKWEHTIVTVTVIFPSLTDGSNAGACGWDEITRELTCLPGAFRLVTRSISIHFIYTDTRHRIRVAMRVSKRKAAAVVACVRGCVGACVRACVRVRFEMWPPSPLGVSAGRSLTPPSPASRSVEFKTRSFREIHPLFRCPM